MAIGEGVVTWLWVIVAIVRVVSVTRGDGDVATVVGCCERGWYTQTAPQVIDYSCLKTKKTV